MSKIYSADKTLLAMAQDVMWGFVQTNQYGESGKTNLLKMRRHGHQLVKKASWDHKQVLRSGVRAKYSDKLAYYYCISFKGFVRLIEVFPDEPILKDMKIELFKRVFSGNDREFINFRL